jgi:hypothetical protein
MNRRSFGKLVGLGALGIVAEPMEAANPGAQEQLSMRPAQAEISQRPVDWRARTYRRLLVDTHVPDWDSHLLADFDPVSYVRTAAKAGFQSLMQYANSHVGLCLWKTKLGQMHAAMKGRDFFGEVMEQCRAHGLHRVAYYSLVFDDWAYANHPDWRILPEEGYDAALYSRTGTCCVNSPYREHAFNCLRELVGNYDFEGIFLDMTFWPAVCYCPHCTKRFWDEHHEEPPRIVDWKDPIWRSFQKCRERWMREFAMEVTKTIKQTRAMAVYQQFGTVFASWQKGVSLEQNEASDFCGGDFYGGAAQFSLVCKAYLGLSRTKPFEFMTTRTLNSHDFETTKPLEQMLMESSIPTIHSAACLLIDAIKPNGELNLSVYEYFSQINAQHDPYEQFLGGELMADVAIYYDKSSMYDPELNGIAASILAPTEAREGAPRRGLLEPPHQTSNLPHLDAVVGTARILREAHIPYGVVTNATLDQLGRFRAVILPSVLEMTAEQAEVFRGFVKDGGALYASGPSSLSAPGDGESRFLLEDVLGVRFAGRVGKFVTQNPDTAPLMWPTYITPEDPELKKLTWPQENVTFPDIVVQGEAKAGAVVLGKVTLPIVPPDAGYTIGTRFAQVWSDPPAQAPGRDPGIVMNSYGNGHAVWVAAPIESRIDRVDALLFMHLLRRILPGPCRFEADANRAVEVTLFHQAENQRLLVGLLNMQDQFPAIPAGATLRIQVPAGHKAKRVLLLPEKSEIRSEEAGSYIKFDISPFSTFAMAMIEYS